MRRTVGIVLALVLTLSLLAACGGGAKPNAGTDNKSAAKGKNVVVVATDNEIDNLDPFAFKSDLAQEVVDATYDTFVDFQVGPGQLGALVADTTKIASNLADMTTSADGKVLTFKLKSGIKFTNGNPVDAEAVRYSIERALKGGGYSALLWGMITVKDPTQVKVVDTQTVQVTLEKGNLMTNTIVPLALNVVMDPKETAKHVGKDDAYAANWYKTNIVGTGPYVKGSNWTQGVQYELAPNPDYWNKGKLKNDGVLIKVVPSADQRFAMLKQGALDVALGLPPKELSDLKNDANIQLYPFKSRNTNYLALNNKVKPFSDKRVRQAIAYAIPYQTLIDKVLYGFGQPLKSPVADGMPTADSSFWKYDTNVEKAKSLLADAGYQNGFKTDLYVSLDRQEDQQSAVWIQSALKAIGIDVQIHKVSDAQYREQQGKGELPMFMEYWYSWGNDPYYQMFWMFKSDNTFTNMSRYANPQVDDLVNKGIYEQDPAKRAEISKQLQQILVDDTPVVLLYQRDYVVAARKNVTGMNLWPDQHLRFFTLSKQ